MNDKIKETIFTETVKTYDHECYSREDLEGFIADLDQEIELALDCYYRFDDEELDQELINLAWNNYDTIRQYNRCVIDGIKAVLRGREPETILRWNGGEF